MGDSDFIAFGCPESKKVYELIKEHKSYKNVIKEEETKRVQFQDSLRALVAFKHQLIYDFTQGNVRHLNPTSQSLDGCCV
ncbi:unnamed protein product [Microthlaspi erraticum]|uniref:Uncharacterized protein n=1 Tax=Microthlaspi erraticum TaxID=1685480 RepID=A0A6D2KQL9_9BRAS|nr:unnamed protein product [Microthlaspi erraticum]